jgi:hypothetical protein
MTEIKIGCGSASSLDPVEYAVALADARVTEFICFDRLSERTLTLAQMRRLQDPDQGHDLHTRDIALALADYLKAGGRIVGNMGAANPRSAADLTVNALRESGATGLRVGVVYGDDVREQVVDDNVWIERLGCGAREMKDRIVSASAYVGAEAIRALIANGCAMVIGGRLADPSMYVAPIAEVLGWAEDDWDRMAAATLAGHLLETGLYTTGGAFADPPYRVVDDADNLGMPWAVVDGDGVLVSKTPGTGGMVTRDTVRAMLGYEIHNPGAYLTPDVSADFRDVTVEQVGPDQVMVRGARGSAKPDQLKVLIGIDHGWKTVGEISFGGPGCIERAEATESLIRKRVARFGDDVDLLQFDRMGDDSLFHGRYRVSYPTEIRFRIAALTSVRSVADAIAEEIEYLTLTGPAGGGGAVASVTRAVGVSPAYLDRSHVEITTEELVA